MLVGLLSPALAQEGASEPSAPAEQKQVPEDATAPAPLTLEEALAYALDHNPRLAASREAMGVAAARLGQARARNRFSLTANYRQTFQGPTITFPLSDSGQKIQVVPDRTSNYSANLSKVLWSSGRLEASQRLARRGVEASQQDWRQTRQEVVLQVTEAYLGVLKTQELREVARQALDQAKEHRRIAQVNLEAGTVAPYDVLRADVEVANAEERRLSAENGVEVAKAALNTALGQDPNAPIEVLPVKREISPAPEQETVLQEALSTRPELLGLQKNVAAAQEGARIARSGRQPNIILDANYNQQTATAFSKDYSWNASLVMSIPLWDGDLSRSQENESRRQVNQLRQTYEQARQGIELEVKQALLNIEEARKRVATAETAVAQAEEGLRIAQVRYEAGVSSAVELIDAETALTTTRTNRVNAIYDYALAWARLEKARGAYAGE